MDRTTIYYFTGTGNSLFIAKKLFERLDNCDLVPIANIWFNDYITTSSEKVGFIFPLYFFGLPKIVFDFIGKIDLKNTNYVFAVITRAGFMDGIALQQIDQILRKKSKNLCAGFFIRMPSNYLLLPEYTPKQEQNELFESVNNSIENIYDFIKNNKKSSKIKINNKKIIPFERMSLTFRNSVNQNDKFFFTDENCDSCGICEKICPVNNILIVNGRPIWQHNCQQCLACINFCHKKSIQHGQKTIGRERYINPQIKIKELINNQRRNISI